MDKIQCPQTWALTQKKDFEFYSFFRKWYDIIEFAISYDSGILIWMERISVKNTNEIIQEIFLEKLIGELSRTLSGPCNRNGKDWKEIVQTLTLATLCTAANLYEIALISRICCGDVHTHCTLQSARTHILPRGPIPSRSFIDSNAIVTCQICR